MTTTHASSYWTKVEREEVTNLGAGSHLLFKDEADRILATVDALEKALRDEHQPGHPDVPGRPWHSPGDCYACDLLAALEEK